MQNTSYDKYMHIFATVDTLDTADNTQNTRKFEEALFITLKIAFLLLKEFFYFFIKKISISEKLEF